MSGRSPSEEEGTGHNAVRWHTTLEGGAIWRALPLGDRLVVGIGGSWRDQHALGLGLRGRVAAFCMNRLVSFCRDGTEQVIFRTEEARPHGVAWWAALRRAACWADRTTYCTAEDP